MRQVTLGELCSAGGGFVQTGPFGSQLHASDYVEVGVPVVMPQDIGENIIVDDAIARVGETEAGRLGKHRLEVGDIVYSRRGDVERRALVRDREAGWLCGTGCLRVHFGSEPEAIPGYISYLLGLQSSRTWIRQHAVGATMLNINTTILSSVPLLIHDLPEQQAIAEVLGALDDKIAANQAVVEASDKMVRAKFQGLQRGCTSSRPLSDVCEMVRSRVSPRVDSERMYLGLEHLPRRLMWVRKSGIEKEIGSIKSEFIRNDVLFGKLRPYFHKVVIAPTEGVCSTDILVVRAQGETAGLILAALASDEAVELAVAGSAGTRMPRTSWSDLAAMQIPWGAEEEMGAFSRSVLNLSDTAIAINEESQRLAALRDALLPELMSGRLRVKDAEKQVEEVL